jgi:hypothetical protein
MLRTNFLISEAEGNKSFSNGNIFELTVNKLPFSDRKHLAKEIGQKAQTSQEWLFFNYTNLELKPNQVYCLEHIKVNADLILPKNPKKNDWVFLYYEPTTLYKNVSFDVKKNITIYGNKKRIMGYDEPLICDIEFSALRLSFIDDIVGWMVS